MTCWLTDEGWDTTLVLAVLAKNGWCAFPEWMLVSILSVSVDLHEMLWGEVALALAPICGDLNLGDLLRPFLLIWVSIKLNLSRI